LVKWIDEEEDLLRKHYPYGDKEFLIKLTGRSWQAIQLKASHMAIKRLAKYNPTKETRRRLSQSLSSYWKGKEMPAEIRQKISQSKKGYKPTKETIEKLRMAHLGSKQSDETKRKISLKNKGKVPWIKGKHHSEVTRKKISLANKGQIPWSKGKKMSAEFRKKCAINQLGKKLSSDAKRKISEANSKEKIDLSGYKDKIISYYKRGYDAHYISNLFNVSSPTIRRRLKRWGIKINKSRFSYTAIITKDGHKVNSNAEKIIDNKLSFFGIKHIREKRILNTNLKCDWYIPKLDLYIEYWGLVGKEFYEYKKEKKLKLYNRNGLNLLSIYPNDLRRIDKILSRIKNKEKNKRLSDFICISSHCHQGTLVQRSSNRELSTLPA